MDGLVDRVDMQQWAPVDKCLVELGMVKLLVVYTVDLTRQKSTAQLD